MARVLMPLPAQGFDPTEAAITWAMLRADGHEVGFATPDGKAAEADPLMLTGQGLDVWGFVPGLNRLPLVGRMLRANADASAAYTAMARDKAFNAPARWDAVTVNDFDGLILPGGHRARGMRPYLESDVLKRLVVSAFADDKAVGAICHGVLLAARSMDPATGRSVLHGRRTTALTWGLERSADALARIVRFWDPSYYRTYPDLQGQAKGYMSVQAEVTRALARSEDFKDVPPGDPRGAGLKRDTAEDASAAFVVIDGRYVSARWPGDAHTFARAFSRILQEQADAQTLAARQPQEA